MRGIARGLFPKLAHLKEVWGQWEYNLMILIRAWGRKLVSCRQVLALTGDSPKWVSEPCVLQMSLKLKGCLKWLSGVPTVLAGQGGGGGKHWMPAERKHTRPPFPLTGKKKSNLFYLSMDWEEWRSWLQQWELGLCFLPPGSLTCPSFSHLPFSPLPSRYTVMRNKISPLSQCVGSEAFILLDCLFYVSSLALKRDWKAPAPGALDLLLMNAAFIT